MPIKFSNFKTVAKQYKAILFDAYGVLKNAEGIYTYVPRMFDFLKNEGIEFLVLTNDASKPPKDLANSYQEKGLNFITEKNLIASSQVAKNYLTSKYKPGTIISYFGIPEAIEFLKDTHFVFQHIDEVKVDKNSDVEAFLFLDHGNFLWEKDINKAINLFRFNPNTEVIVANSDLSYPSSGTEIALAIGGIAQMIENILGKEFIKFGKPNTRMFQLAFDTLNEKQVFMKKDVLMVGDTLTTDIIGGNNFGIDTALVLSGATQEKELENLIQTNGIKPTHICKSTLIF